MRRTSGIGASQRYPRGVLRGAQCAAFARRKSPALCAL
jgi:hypothetical protein